MRAGLLGVLVLVFALAVALPAAVPLTVPEAARASAHFDAQAATNAWLNTVPAAARARSDAYFEGGYWLLLWDTAWLVAVMFLLLETGLSARLCNLAARVARAAWPQAYLYWLLFAAITALLLFPLTVYEGFLREHQYGLSNQTFAAWLRETAIAFLLTAFLGGLAVASLLVVVKRLPRSWHLWSTGVALVFIVVSAVIAPVFLAPIFNKYTPLAESPLKAQILALARANGIPARDVFEVDASRQSKRVSANVSGLFGTDRITLNDNLLARCSPESVLSVMGHEMGHYVMHHIQNAMLFTAIFLFVLFLILRAALVWAETRCATRWRLTGRADFALLPFAVAVLASLNLLLTPLQNSYTRTQEYEADIFGLDAARQPDGEAQVDLLLGEYRKLDPAPLEEMLFFDHPSGRTRIFAAMRWKAENLCLFDPALPCAATPFPKVRTRPPAAPLR